MHECNWLSYMLTRSGIPLVWLIVEIVMVVLNFVLPALCFRVIEDIKTYVSPSHSHTGPTQHLSLMHMPLTYTEYHNMQITDNRHIPSWMSYDHYCCALKDESVTGDANRGNFLAMLKLSAKMQNTFHNEANIRPTSLTSLLEELSKSHFYGKPMHPWGQIICKHK